MSLLAIIPARIGSKGIPKKNIKLLANKPLIAYTIEEALKVSNIDKIIVSTDSQEIAEIAIKYGAEVPFLRPDEYSDDKSTSYEVVEHALQNLPYFKEVILLQPTSPLRLSKDIKGIIKDKKKLKCSSILSVTQSKFHPYLGYEIIENKVLKPLSSKNKNVLRRQDLEPVFIPNGAIYLCETKWLKTTKSFINYSSRAYIMPEERSIDIDTELDWLIAEFLLGKMRL